MPGIVRKNTDSHVGHASPTPNPFHQTAYATAAEKVFVNGAEAVRITDTTGCGDPASEGSSNVFAEGLGVHRKGDATSGHGSWVANSAATGSGDVKANGD
mgnify:FL=1|jgi:uncharacterized Zn-binding protein involved in type VI secretion